MIKKVENDGHDNNATQLYRGLVISRSGAGIEVWLEEEGRAVNGILRGKLRKTLKGIYAGDRVQGRVISDSEYVIDSLLERRNLLPQPHVANVDKILIVVTWHEPEFNNIVLDGLLAQAEYFAVKAEIVFNKIDLLTYEELEKVYQWATLYQQIGYPVFFTSAITQEGLDKLANSIQDQLTVLAGLSGVGKSSILNSLIPGASLRIGQISEKTGRGRHTTTDIRLLRGPMGGWIADTPGFHRVDLDEWIELGELSTLYKEFLQYPCAFNDCAHVSEPGCGVKAAVQEGKIMQYRYNSYIFWRQAIQRAFEQGRRSYKK